MANISEKQVKEYREAFDLFDQNRNGFISKKELATCTRYFGLNYTDKELAKYFEDFDQDGNGRIDFKEYLTVVSNPEKKRDIDKKEIIEAFGVFDRDKDGFVNAKEFSDAMQTLGNRMSVAEVKEMLKAGDFNEDGKIDINEFATMMFS